MENKHPVYGSMVSLGKTPRIGVPVVREAEGISFLMKEWEEYVKKEQVDFYSYVVMFHAMDHPFDDVRVGYRAVHMEDFSLAVKEQEMAEIRRYLDYERWVEMKSGGELGRGTYIDEIAEGLWDDGGVNNG